MTTVTDINAWLKDYQGGAVAYGSLNFRVDAVCPFNALGRIVSIFCR